MRDMWDNIKWSNISNSQKKKRRAVLGGKEKHLKK